MTNRQMMGIKGLDDETVQEIVCEYCTDHRCFTGYDLPLNFLCEGRFCSKAWDKWLDEEWECEDE